MRIFVVRAEGAIGARLATQLIDHDHQMIGTRRSPRNAGRVRGLSAEPSSARPAADACAAPHRGEFLMPIGYLWTVAVVSWGVACALTRWRRLGTFSAIPALVVSELPFLVGYLLIASTVLALADGDLGSPAGAAAAASRCSPWPAWWSSCAARCARTRHCATPVSRGGRGAASCAPRSSRAGSTWSGCAALPTATGRTARWTSITAVTGRPALRSCCTSMAAASIPATRPAKRGR